MRVICIDDVLSRFSEHDQAFVRRALEVGWDDSDIFTVEVVIPLRNPPYMDVLEVTVDPVNEVLSVEGGY